MRVINGLLLAVLVAVLILYAFAFASMIDPAVGDVGWRATLLRRMFVQAGIAEATYMGLGLITVGLALARWRWLGDRAWPRFRGFGRTGRDTRA